MAVVKTIKFDWGPTVRIHDDDIEPDQEKAWAHARAVQAECNRIWARKQAEARATEAKAKAIT